MFQPIGGQFFIITEVGGLMLKARAYARLVLLWTSRATVRLLGLLMAQTLVDRPGNGEQRQIARTKGPGRRGKQDGAHPGQGAQPTAKEVPPPARCAAVKGRGGKEEYQGQQEVDSEPVGQGQGPDIYGRKQQDNRQAPVEQRAAAAQMEFPQVQHVLVEAGAEGLVGHLKVPRVFPPEPPEIDRGLVPTHLNCPEAGL